MAGALRLNKAERKWLLEVAGASEALAARSILTKLEKIEVKPKVAVGVPIQEVIEIFRGVLGARLLPPLPSARVIFVTLQRRVTALGLSRQDCVTVAKQADYEWRNGRIKVESLIRQAETLLANSQQQLPGTQLPPGRRDDLEDL